MSRESSNQANNARKDPASPPSDQTQGEQAQGLTTGDIDPATVTADEDDTVLESAFYATFMAGYPADPTPAQRAEKAALEQAR